MATCRILLAALPTIFCSLGLLPAVEAQEPVLPRPQRASRLRGAPDHYPLGGLGAEVDVLSPGEAAAKGVKSRGCVILIRKLFPAEPARNALNLAAKSSIILLSYQNRVIIGQIA